MSLPDEEARAALHREQLAARARAEKARESALAGSAQARRELEEAWKPIRDQQTDRQTGR